MIKIAFCDDDMEVLHQMNELLDRYRVERNEDITYAAFQSPFELLTEIISALDILLLIFLIVQQQIQHIQAVRENHICPSGLP